MSAFCHWEDNTLVLNILGRPRAKKTKIGKDSTKKVLKPLYLLTC